MTKSLRLSAAILLLFLIGLGFVLTSREFLRSLFPVGYIPEIDAIACQHGIDPYLALAVMRVESNFDPRAQSKPGARGLMQILPETADWIAQMRSESDFSPEHLYLPEVNIDYGCWYLNYLLEMFDNDIHLTLAAYNAGLGRVKQWLADEEWDGRPETINAIPFGETRFFVRKVLMIKSMYQWIYPDLFPGMERSM
ncbi:MAG: lytic transglycosylase domain-containing protein [Firmicutes bacterium]|nr:lytic transglycosylase domain-containing protein [Bacillota bacterium]